MTVVGQNRFTETEDSPLTAGRGRRHPHPGPGGRARARGGARATGATERDDAAVEQALSELAAAAGDESANIMPATIAAAKAGATTGEWAQTLRDVFGDYRAPTGVSGSASGGNGDMLAATRGARRRARRERWDTGPGSSSASPGLDGHSNGAEQIAVRARDVGMEVIYQGIRLTPEQIVASAIQEDVDVVGLSILSGSHRELVPETVRLLSEQGADVPVVVGGIIPAADAVYLRENGVAGVYTPKDFDLSRIMSEIVDLVAERNGVDPLPPERPMQPASGELP